MFVMKENMNKSRRVKLFPFLQILSYVDERTASYAHIETGVNSV
jgi:hypothetical protein